MNVVVRATLLRGQDRSIVAEKTFSSVQRASDNRVGPMVAAFDAGVQQVLGGLITWSASAAR